MSAKKPTIQYTKDLNGNDDGRTSIEYDEAVKLDFEVLRDPSAVRRGKNAPFIARVGWGSQGSLSLEQAESFAAALFDGVQRARADIARRSSKTQNTKAA